jgi:filamentous hemagglutinin
LVDFRRFAEADGLPRQVYGFKGAMQLLQHFGDHGSDFNCADKYEYEGLAVAFASKPLTARILELARASGNGHVVRFDQDTDEFAVVDRNGYVLTYYNPNPAIHGKATNLDYFYATVRS